jgi:hypothetical protein
VVVNRKVGKYRALATANQLEFIRLVFESTGYVQDLACAFINKSAEYSGKVRLILCTTVYKYWMTQISVTLQKALCSALMRRVINATSKDGGVNAGQLLDVVEESAVFRDHSMR